MKNQYLAHYLPHELAMLHLVTVWTGNPPEPSHDEEGVSTLTIENFGQMMKYGTPLLRPLSDLTKEITHNGEKFVPAIEISKIFLLYPLDTLKIQDNERDNYILIGTRISDQTYQLKRRPERMEFWQVQKLISWHFDVFGLIEKREAIDMNTIN